MNPSQYRHARHSPQYRSLEFSDILRENPKTIALVGGIRGITRGLETGRASSSGIEHVVGNTLLGGVLGGLSAAQSMYNAQRDIEFRWRAGEAPTSHNWWYALFGIFLILLIVTSVTTLTGYHWKAKSTKERNRERIQLIMADSEDADDMTSVSTSS